MLGYFYQQSEYCFLDNLIKLEKLIQLNKDAKYDFIAISDTNLHAAVKLYKYCDEHDIKPILGLKVNFTYNNENTSLLAYVKDEQGYKNLLFFNEKKHLTYLDIKNNSEGLFFITPGYECITAKKILFDNIEYAISTLFEYKNDIDIYIGIDLNNLEQENIVAPKLYEISSKLKIKTLPVNKTSYENIFDKEYYETINKIKDVNTRFLNDYDFSFLNKERLLQRYSEYEVTLKNIDEVVEKSNFSFKKLKFNMPVFDKKKDSNKELIKKANEGLLEKLKQTNKSLEKYKKRLDYELKIIIDLNFSDYFLIVSDFVNYAKNNKVFVGPGRGSAAGSLVSYALNIIEPDPVKFDLFFERFLNPFRKTMPDIDIDFPDNKRDDVINYVCSKYGKNHIASIVTFDRFALKSSIRDIIRAKQLKLDPVKIIRDHKLDRLDISDQNILSVIETAKKISGLPRHTGTHPSGIILISESLVENIPVMTGAFDFYQSQFEMNDLETLNILKIDFLGIRNLKIIDDTVNLIKKENSNFDIKKISFADKKTYDLLSIGDSNGIFQLESDGMKKTMIKLKPDCFNDIVDLIALYRPGPMENIDLYIERKKDNNFLYLHKDLEDILKSTKGIIIYQEQIMQIVSKFAGFSLSDADLFRRAISKKNIDILNKEKKHFINGCLENKYSIQIAQNLYDYIIKFADYGFNKSHSVSYSVVSYMMAYLKANYFLEFAISVLQTIIGNETLTYTYIRELISRGYTVVPPYINIATEKYTIFENKIVLPLTLIKGIGIETIKKYFSIKDNIDFTSYRDFKIKTAKIFSDKNIENLINSNSLDIFKISHEEMLDNIKQDSSLTIFLVDHIKPQTYKKLSITEKLEFEKKAFGFNIFYSISNLISDEFRKKHDIILINNINNLSRFKIFGYIENIKQILTKNNKKMAFIEVNDGYETISITLFTEIYELFLNTKESEFHIFTIKTNKYQDKTTFVCEKIEIYNKK